MRTSEPLEHQKDLSFWVASENIYFSKSVRSRSSRAWWGEGAELDRGPAQYTVRQHAAYERELSMAYLSLEFVQVPDALRVDEQLFLPTKIGKKNCSTDDTTTAVHPHKYTNISSNNTNNSSSSPNGHAMLRLNYAYLCGHHHNT